MPKTTRRTSASRAEPYPTENKSPPKSVKKTPHTTKFKPSPPKKALAEKSQSDTNASSPNKTSAKWPMPDSDAPSNPSDSFLDTGIDTRPDDEGSYLPIYDTCSVIRQKKNALLGKDNAKPENGNPEDLRKDGSRKPFTKASFVRVIGDGSVKALDLFLSKRRVMAGAESPVCPAAYLFFEQKRVFEGKKKSVKRLEIENERPKGLPLEDPNNIRILCEKGEDLSPFFDKRGQYLEGI